MSDDGPEYYATARDVVRLHPGPDYNLEVFSRRPKDHWTANVMEILYDGEAYVLADRAVIEAEGKPTRYRFLLKKADTHTLSSSACEYHPEEVREIYRQELLRSSAMWVEGFAFVWGLLDEERQQGLGRLYDYGPFRSTGWSLAATAALGTGLVLSNLLMMNARTTVGLSPTTLEYVMLITGLLVLGEALLRWIPYNAGRIRPSVVAPLLRPLADRFQRWENWPGRAP